MDWAWVGLLLVSPSTYGWWIFWPFCQRWSLAVYSNGLVTDDSQEDGSP